MSGQINQIAVIGAGIAGITCARELQSSGFSVTLFDKSKGLGGRMSHRLFENWGADHGAQYFTAKTPLFQQALKTWLTAEIVKPWNRKIVAIQGQSQKPLENKDTRFVSTPAMNSLAKFLADGIEIKTNHTISKIHRTDRGWQLHSNEQGLYPESFDYVVIAIPPPQAANLLGNTTPRLQNICESSRMLPCWTLIAYFDKLITLPFDGAFLEGSIFSWIARDNSKPDRPQAETWIAQATPEWSLQHIDETNYQVEPELVSHFEKLINSRCTLYQRHLWRYARVENPLESDFELDTKLQLALCGDWFIHSTVEGAWTSGYLLAQAIKQL